MLLKLALTHCLTVLYHGLAGNTPSLHQTPEADVEGKIFLGGLTWQTTEEMLKTHFGKWGTLNDVILMRNKITGEPRGFGFVQFQDSSCGFRLVTCRCYCGVDQDVPVYKRCLVVMFTHMTPLLILLLLVGQDRERSQYWHRSHFAVPCPHRTRLACGVICYCLVIVTARCDMHTYLDLP